MSDNNCNCGDLAVDQASEQTTNGDNWVAERPVTTARLPDDMADNMGRFFGESIETFDDMISAFRTVVDGDGIAVDELCHVEEETPHYAQTADETYYFRCFYDGIALAHLVDEPVEIRTETPRNDVIEMQASPSSPRSPSRWRPAGSATATGGSTREFRPPSPSSRRWAATRASSPD